MKHFKMMVVAVGLGVLLAISFGVFLFVVLGLQAATVVATGGALILMFLLGLCAGARSVAAEHALPRHGLANRAG